MDQTNICPTCKFPNPVENIFCQSCGTKLDMVASPAPAQFSMPAGPAPAQTQYAMPPAGQPVYNGYAPQVYPAPAPTLERLGSVVDDFADVVENGAEKIAGVEAAFDAALRAHAMPGVSITRSDLASGDTPTRRRAYTLVSNAAGATMAVNFSAFGKDMVASWELRVRRRLNLIALILMAAALVILPAIPAAFTGILFFSTYISLFGSLIVIIPLACILLGKVLQDDFWHFFVKEMDSFDSLDTTAMQLVVHEAVMEALEGFEEPEVEPEPVEKPQTKARAAKKS